MMYYQQQMQKVIRSLLPVRKSILTVSECELLAHLYFQPEENTPVLLGKSSGMKKEAVSRCLKSLYEKNCIRKQKQTKDERSYEDFEAFMYYADKLAAHIEKGKENTHDEIL